MLNSVGKIADLEKKLLEKRAGLDGLDGSEKKHIQESSEAFMFVYQEITESLVNGSNIEAHPDLTSIALAFFLKGLLGAIEGDYPQYRNILRNKVLEIIADIE